MLLQSSVRRIAGGARCYARAVLDLLLHWVWIPHVYEEVDYERCIIISTDRSFRVSRSLEHTVGETVHKDACLIRSRCIYCGKEDLSWIPDWTEAMRRLGEYVRRAK